MGSKGFILVVVHPAGSSFPCKAEKTSNQEIAQAFRTIQHIWQRVNGDGMRSAFLAFFGCQDRAFSDRSGREAGQ